MDRAVFIHNTLRDFVSHLGLRVTDDDIIRSQQEAVGDLALGAEGFAAARRA